MKEISRIVSGLNALRLVEDKEKRWCEVFESGEWAKLTPARIQMSDFDKKVKDWLEQNYDLKKSVPKFSDSQEKAIG
jgi:hypothetical protein